MSAPGAVRGVHPARHGDLTRLQSIVYDDGVMRLLRVVGLATFALGVAAFAAVDAQQKPSARPAAPRSMRPAPRGALPPLPQVSFEPVRPMPIVRQVYEFAARHPDVLGFIPCYCGCERMGHTGNHDCFVKSRAADGRVIEWDSHGLGCAICLDVGRQAMTMFNQGMSVRAIRTAIDREYGARFPSHTHTPQPPTAGTTHPGGKS